MVFTRAINGSIQVVHSLILPTGESAIQDNGIMLLLSYSGKSIQKDKIWPVWQILLKVYFRQHKEDEISVPVLKAVDDTSDQMVKCLRDIQ